MGCIYRMVEAPEVDGLDLTAFVEGYRAEAAEHLHALDTQLLALERDPSAAGPVREMFLSAHTIKGGAAMLDLTDIRVLAHAIEDVLAALRDGQCQLDSGMADLLFRALDALHERVERSTPGNAEPDTAVRALEAALRQQIAGPSADVAVGAAEETVPASRPRALLVEDSATVRMLETMFLSDAGFSVDAVADGNQALDLALATTYQLVVTGIEVRGLRGLELAERLRRQPPYQSIPLIIMSSDDNAQHRRRAAELDVHAYIRKGSFGQQRLIEAAREALTNMLP